MTTYIACSVGYVKNYYAYAMHVLIFIFSIFKVTETSLTYWLFVDRYSIDSQS